MRNYNCRALYQIIDEICFFLSTEQLETHLKEIRSVSRHIKKTSFLLQVTQYHQVT